MANEVLPSVVTISVSGPGGAGTGSGEILQSSGYIVTNNHVIAPAASCGPIQVLFTDGASDPATLVGRDAQTDLAVIKVKATEGMNPSRWVLASVEVGQPVVVLGAPLGLSNTVTSGIVSALDRTVDVPGDVTRPLCWYRRCRPTPRSTRATAEGRWTNLRVSYPHPVGRGDRAD